jgi:hypothetical protein
MDWFEALTGFRETTYDDTRARLRVEGAELVSLVNGQRYGIGELEMVSLEALRERAKSAGAHPGRLKVSVVRGDVRAMHRAPEFAGALFQVASQFNCLEMPSPDVTPEHGVTGYAHDHTQGPACAIAAGAATIYRNYFLPVAGRPGQTAGRQLNGLKQLGEALEAVLECDVDDLWEMRNGYALCTREGLDAIAKLLGPLPPQQTDWLRQQVRIGLHRYVQVTDVDGAKAAGAPAQFVSQAFCSALPVAYSDVPAKAWQPFASLVLEAAYEATLWAGVLNAQQGVSNIVLLTSLGGGAFGNDAAWIYAAMRRALRLVKECDLDVRIVSYGTPADEMVEMAREFG